MTIENPKTNEAELPPPPRKEEKEQLDRREYRGAGESPLERAYEISKSLIEADKTPEDLEREKEERKDQFLNRFITKHPEESTVGLYEKKIKDLVRKQETMMRRLDHLQNPAEKTLATIGGILRLYDEQLDWLQELASEWGLEDQIQELMSAEGRQKIMAETIEENREAPQRPKSKYNIDFYIPKGKKPETTTQSETSEYEPISNKEDEKDKEESLKGDETLIPHEAAQQIGWKFDQDRGVSEEEKIEVEENQTKHNTSEVPLGHIRRWPLGRKYEIRLKEDKRDQPPTAEEVYGDLRTRGEVQSTQAVGEIEGAEDHVASSETFDALYRAVREFDGIVSADFGTLGIEKSAKRLYSSDEISELVSRFRRGELAARFLPVEHGIRERAMAIQKNEATLKRPGEAGYSFGQTAEILADSIPDNFDPALAFYKRDKQFETFLKDADINFAASDRPNDELITAWYKDYHMIPRISAEIEAALRRSLGEYDIDLDRKEAQAAARYIGEILRRYVVRDPERLHHMRESADEIFQLGVRLAISEEGEKEEINKDFQKKTSALLSELGFKKEFFETVKENSKRRTSEPKPRKRRQKNKFKKQKYHS